MALMLAVIGFLFKRIANLESSIDHTRDNYVRRDDNENTTLRIEKSVADLRLELKDVSAMMLRLLLEASGKS